MYVLPSGPCSNNGGLLIIQIAILFNLFLFLEAIERTEDKGVA